VDGTGSVFFLMVSFGISGVESSGSTSRKLINKMDGMCMLWGW
jgi:hypothetical protein